MKRFRILDWYVHQGHQYEFFKGNHDYFLVDFNKSKPLWNKKHRPLGNNVHLISEAKAKLLDFDIVIVRTPIPSKRYQYFIERGARAIAVIQTTNPIWLAPGIRHVVWNSREAMKKKVGFYRNRSQHFIVHGYDPNEFKPLRTEIKNERVLTVANHFKKRDNIMGYDIWKFVKDEIPECDVIGSENEEIPNSINHKNSLNELIKAYNQYSVYFNPTRLSAMPRSRAEAAMCGMPIVSTMNYDFKKFFRPGKDALLSNDPETLHLYIKSLLESEQMRLDYGMAAREAAIKHFHIDDFLSNWDRVFNRALE